MKFGQQKPLASASSRLLLLLLLVVVVAHLTAASDDDTMSREISGKPASAVHLRNNHNKLPLLMAHNKPRKIRGSWQAADHWCRSRGRGGLAQILGESDASIETLAARTRDLSPAGCYWIGLAATVSIDELRWLIDNPGHDDTGCLCVMVDGGRSGRRSVSAAGASTPRQPRLHLARCLKRLPFLCQRPLLAPHRAISTQQGKAKKQQNSVKHNRPMATPKKPASVELISDSEVQDSEEVDSQEDHGKIPEFTEGKGILNPWPTTAAAAVDSQKPPSSSGNPLNATGLEDNETVATPEGSWHREDGNHNLIAPSQRSEFVTLLVLYSIVGVVCLVLVALCLVRCVRECCGTRSRVRYVKQVDADDIPRFMPSSWA